MAAVNTHHVDDESEFLSSEGDVLLLESSLLRLVRPTESFVDVNATDDTDYHRNHLPACSLAKLKRKIYNV